MNLLARVFRGRAAGTLQTQPQPGRDQVRADSGGYVYPLDRWARVDRFLILGSEGGTYYASEARLTKENAVNLIEAIREDGQRVVARVIALSVSGRAPKVQPAIFALAACAGLGDELTRHYALGEGLRRVCRTGSHLLMFCSYIEQFRGWGRGLRKALRVWYESWPVRDLAYQALKYQNREGFTHRDVFRLAHPLATDAERAALYAWIGKGDVPNAEFGSLALLRAHSAAKVSEDADAATCAELVRTSGLPREALPSTWLKEPRVWEALLPGLPATALIRNLATLTRVGLLTPKGEATATVIARITDRTALRKARIHPIALLAALTTYASGRNARGSGTWSISSISTSATGTGSPSTPRSACRSRTSNRRAHERSSVSTSRARCRAARSRGSRGSRRASGRRRWRSRSFARNATSGSWRSRKGSSRSRSAATRASRRSSPERTRFRSWERTARSRCSTPSSTGSRSTCSSC